MGSRLCCFKRVQTSSDADEKSKVERQPGIVNSYIEDPTAAPNRPGVVSAQTVQNLIDEGRLLTYLLILSCIYNSVV